MRKFLLDLCSTIVVSLVVLPAAIFGFSVAGWLYDKKIEPWLGKTFKNHKEGGE